MLTLSLNLNLLYHHKTGFVKQLYNKYMNKTVPTGKDVSDFLNSLDDEQQIGDSLTLIDIMKRVSGDEPEMWGSSIIGFGRFQYVNSTGKPNNWMKIGFSPRKGKISLYITVGADKYAHELEQMGKHKTGKGCIYISKLSDVKLNKLEELIAKAYKDDYLT